MAGISFYRFESIRVSILLPPQDDLVLSRKKFHIGIIKDLQGKFLLGGDLGKLWGIKSAPFARKRHFGHFFPALIRFDGEFYSIGGHLFQHGSYRYDKSGYLIFRPPELTQVRTECLWSFEYVVPLAIVL